MSIVTATSQFEEWLGKHLTLVGSDLDRKHLNMTTSALVFLRATFYRWAQRWPALCENQQTAPEVDSVVDLHIENFGTWRDAEGRLIWGVNDGDEAFRVPYTFDLTRLATSAAALGSGGLLSGVSRACDAIMLGYKKGLQAGPRPFVLAEKHAKLRKMAQGELRDPRAYWDRMTRLPEAVNVPDDAVAVLQRAMPRGLNYRIATRQAGEGSLGRQRFVAVGELAGGMIAREIKAVAPSAILWARNSKTTPLYYQTFLDSPNRVKDPYTSLEGRWILRRLAPDCSRIDLAALKAISDETVLLKAMGRELCNIHLGTPGSQKLILADLQRRKRFWLEEAVEVMVDANAKDWRAWRKHMKAN